MSEGYSLKDYTSWKVGGTCSMFIAPHTVEEACEILKCCKEANRELFILGGGTNVLVADGYNDVAVLYTGHIKGIKARELDNGYTELNVACGCTTKEIIAYALEHSLTGVEFLTGIPGTVGGALYGNAGGRAETGFNAIVNEITVVASDCSLRKYGKERIRWQYRTCPVDKSDLMIVSCKLLLSKAPKQEIIENTRKFAELKKGQPIGKATAGCVFKNPTGMSAGKLIDDAGCRGLQYGGASVSACHANFIENQDAATAEEIYELCEQCRKTVLKKYGVKLEYEIKFLGNFKKNRVID